MEKEPIKNIINIINPFMIKFLPKYRKEHDLDKVPLFANNNVTKLVEHFFAWLTNKKYLAFKIRVNEQYSFPQEQ